MKTISDIMPCPECGQFELVRVIKTIGCLVQDGNVAETLDEKWEEVRPFVPTGKLAEVIEPIKKYFEQFETLEDLEDELGL